MAGFDLRQVRMFLAVHRHGSFTGAAQHLGVAQSTVSTAILEFERTLGQSVFVREGRRVRLSALGEVILPHAERLARTESDLQEAVRTFRGDRARSLTLATNESVSTYLLSNVTRRVARTCPELTVQVNLGLCPVIREQVMTGSADVAVLVEPDRPEDAREGATSIAQTPLVLFCGPSSPLAARAVRLADLRDRTVVMTYTAGTYARLLNGVFRREGFPDVRTQALGSIEAVKRHVRADGEAVALLPAFVLHDEIASGEFVALKLERSLPQVQVKVLWSATSNARDARDVVHDALREALLSRLPLFAVSGAPR